MSRTVFWSWQSDRDERVARHVIREAIVIALDRLSGDVDVEDRLEIDHDTRGLPGSPDIVTAILEKIDAADVFVADVTPIAVSDKGKHVANPNVLIELGYAKKSLGQDRWITVWNTAFTDCRVEDLPFDLRGKRGPITYSLPTGATKTELSQARDALVAQFLQRIGDSLDSLPVVPASPIEWQPSVASDRSTWIAAGTPININEDMESGTKELLEGGRWYVRILPSAFDTTAMDSGACAPTAAIGGNGYSWGNTTGGVITYAGSVRADHIQRQLRGATMWFRKTGEIWATHTGIKSENNGRSYFYGDDIAKYWAIFLWYGLVSLTKNGGVGPFQIRLGVNGLSGLYWDTGNMFRSQPSMALEDSIEKEFRVSGFAYDDWKTQFVEAWTDLRRIFSIPNPSSQHIDNMMNNCR